MQDLEKARTRELDRLIQKAKSVSKKTKSDSTKRAYKSDMRAFELWCSQFELEHLPAEPETVALYIVACDQSGYRPSTIRRHLTSISQAHELAGHQNPVNRQVLELKKGIYRLRGRKMNKKTPITVERLRRIVGYTPCDFLGIRDRAILLVGWTGALRRSEICAIDVEHLEDRAEGIAVTLIRSKTDQEGETRQIGLPFIDSPKSLCAARTLRHWLSLAKITSGPCFVGVGKGGKDRFFASPRPQRLSDREISRIVKRACERAGYDPSSFGGHSLRSGLATSLAAIGTEERKIMNITGHRKLETLREYIRQGGLFHAHPVTILFSSSSSVSVSSPVLSSEVSEED